MKSCTQISKKIIQVATTTFFVLVSLTTTSWSQSVVNPRTLDDETLARLALTTVGADIPGSSLKCAGCHTLDAQNLNRWGTQFSRINQWCLHGKSPANLSVDESKDAVRCLLENPEDSGSRYHPSRLGFWAGGASELKPVFQKSGIVSWEAQFQEFLDVVKMPRNGEEGFTTDDLAIFNEWIRRNYTKIEVFLGQVEKPSAECIPQSSPELKAHIRTMAASGWSAVNRFRGLLMFGCQPGAAATSCFQMKNRAGADLFPKVENLQPWARANAQPARWTLRKIVEFPNSTSFWVRTSADGRFTASGMRDLPSFGAGILDLNPILSGNSPRVIPVASSYDPGFFPDNSGFSFQGGNSGTLFCSMRTLLDPANRNITGNTRGCTATTLGLYHSSGVGLSGDDYIAIHGSFVNDSAGESIQDFPSRMRLQFLPLLFDGIAYRPQPSVMKEFSFEGDFIISPSTSLLVSRASGVDLQSAQRTVVQKSYNLHGIKRTVSDGVMQISATNLGTVCARGGKGTFSYDERFFTFHHRVSTEDYRDFGYSSPNDPEFTRYVESRASNIYLHDMLTGKTHRITKFAAGQVALFPHFRSDGWLHFLANGNGERRSLMASDAAIVITQSEAR